MFPSMAAAEAQLTCLVTESYNKSAETRPFSQSPWQAPSFPAPSDLCGHHAHRLQLFAEPPGPCWEGAQV